jgi:tetratricopeptide (TPR) repeat protein
VPTSNLAAMPNMRADRFMYLPSLAVCLGLAAATLAAGRALASRLGRPQLLLVPLAALAVLHGAVLAGTAFTYRSNGQLWATARRVAPGSARAQAASGELLLANLGGAPDQARRDLLLARAEAHCINAERLDPHYELPQLCFARVAAARKDWTEARRRFAAALAVSPDRNARIFAGLAQTSLDLRDVPEPRRRELALDALEQGLRAHPYAPELHDVAGQIFHRLGDPLRALEHYRRAHVLAPERGESLLAQLALLLDLGLPLAARKLVEANRPSWLAANPVDRTALIARQRDALRLYAPTMILFADLDGVFANEP